MSFNLITILGPTATGKTALAVRLAEKYSGEIISADSRQVYKFMDIGTGKDLAEYEVNGSRIRYHLIDILHPSEEFNVFEFQKLFYDAFQTTAENGNIPFLVGGTGMYLDSVLKGYQMPVAKDEFDPAWEEMSLERLAELLKRRNPNLHNSTDLLDRERVTRALRLTYADKAREFPQINSLVLGVSLPREDVKSKITARLKSRLQSGMIEEAENLIEIGIPHKKLEFFGLEYKYISLYLRGELNHNDMFQKLNSSIHKFAKRQMTWFRKMEREGLKINWLDGADFKRAAEIIDKNYFRQTD